MGGRGGRRGGGGAGRAAGAGRDGAGPGVQLKPPLMSAGGGGERLRTPRTAAPAVEAGDKQVWKREMLGAFQGGREGGKSGRQAGRQGRQRTLGRILVWGRVRGGLSQAFLGKHPVVNNWGAGGGGNGDGGGD